MARAPGFAKHPGHRVEVAPHAGRVRVRFGGEVVADTARALRVLESGHAPVLYVPRADVRDECLAPSDHQTYCPFKGRASYWSLQAGGQRAENALWGYEDPYDEVRALAGHVAFYPERVDVLEDASDRSR